VAGIEDRRLVSGIYTGGRFSDGKLRIAGYALRGHFRHLFFVEDDCLSGVFKYCSLFGAFIFFCFIFGLDSMCLSYDTFGQAN